MDTPEENLGEPANQIADQIAEDNLTDPGESPIESPCTNQNNGKVEGLVRVSSVASDIIRHDDDELKDQMAPEKSSSFLQEENVASDSLDIQRE